MVKNFEQQTLTDGISLAPVSWDRLKADERVRLLARPAASSDPDRKALVEEIVRNVKTGGDRAVRYYTKKFDGTDTEVTTVSSQETGDACARMDPQNLAAMKMAIKNVTKFHMLQKPKSIGCETSPGIFCSLKPVPFRRAGLYVPGGEVPLPSSVWMQAVPAKIAGVEDLILCTPPGKNGLVADEILAAARLTGVNRVFKIGGAQAVAAMAFGTESVPSVDIICGPGNSWVSNAKQYVSTQPGGPAIDMEAGPSEVLIIADSSANPEFIASDLIAQAEHGPDSQVILLSTSREVAKKTGEELLKQASRLPRWATILQNFRYLRSFLVPDIETAVEISNEWAPEHLIIQTESPSDVASDIRNAGSVFLGKWAPETVGDYASGTNHVLPTNGLARRQSGLSVNSFLKFISFQSLTKEALRVIGPVTERLAAIEGLDGHKNAVSVRLRTMEDRTCQ